MAPAGWGTRLANPASLMIDGLGPAFVLALTACVAISEAFGALHWRFLHSQAASLAVLVLVVAAPVVTLAVLSAGTRSSGQVPGARHAVATRHTLVAAVPAGLLLALLLASSVRPMPQRVEWFLGGDHLRHLVLVAHEQAVGYLDYAASPYPQGWHSLVTVGWSAAGGSRDATGLASLVTWMSVAAWCLSALLALVVAQLARSAARRSGLGPATATGAALVAGTLTLGPTFLANYQSLGFETSLVACVLLAVAAREVVERAASVRALVVTAAATAVMAHVWQLLLPAAAVTFLAVVVAVVRDARSSGAATGVMGRSSTVVAVVLSATVATVVGMPGLLAVVRDVGVGHARDAQVDAPLPLLLLPVGLVSVVALAALRRSRASWLLAALVGTVVATACLLALVLAMPVTQYYPAKLLWTAAVLALPALACWVSLGLRRLWQADLRAAAALRVAVGVVTAAVVGLCVASAAQPLFGGWTTTDGPVVLGAVTTPHADRAQVVWLPDPDPLQATIDSTRAGILLDFFGKGRVVYVRPQSPLTVDQECELLRAAAKPAVLSSAPAPEVRRRYACAQDLEVLGSP